MSTVAFVSVAAFKRVIINIASTTLSYDGNYIKHASVRNCEKISFGHEIHSWTVIISCITTYCCRVLARKAFQTMMFSMTYLISTSVKFIDYIFWAFWKSAFSFPLLWIYPLWIDLFTRSLINRISWLLTSITDW